MSTLLLLPLLLAPSPAATDVTLGLTLEAHEVRTGAPLALTVTVDNPTGDLLVGVDVGLELRDAAGLVVTDWTLGVPVVTGMAALDGSASLGPGASASGAFALTPGPALAGVHDLVVTVAATLEGDALVRDLPAAAVRVVPAAVLDVEVFVPPRLHGDWSATPLVFEPAEPFPLGVVIRNAGGGPALGLELDAEGPSVPSDPTGAATGAVALALDLDGQPTPAGFGLGPDLVGDLAAGVRRELLWTGLPFVRADPTGLDLALAWGDGLAGPLVAAPASLATFTLVHPAEVFETAAGPLDDGLVDWLVDDPAVAPPTDPVTGGPMEAFPDLVRASTGPDLALVPVVTPTVGAPPSLGDLVTDVTFTAAVAGWHHLRIDAPGGAYFDLAQVVRSAKAARLPGLTVGGPGDVSRVWVTERPLDVTGDGVPDVTRRLVHIVDFVAAPGPVAFDLVHLPSAAEALSADTELLAASVGGTQTLFLDAGPDHAGATYQVLGSVTGTAPGLLLDGVLVPLNVDAYFLRTLTQPVSPTMVGGLGVLDAQGRATAQVIVPGGFPAGVGLTAHHAFVVLSPTVFPLALASNPVPLFVLP